MACSGNIFHVVMMYEKLGSSYFLEHHAENIGPEFCCCQNGFIEADEPPERIATAEERMERLNLEQVPENAVCVRSSGTPPPHGVRLTHAERGNPNSENERTNQPT